MDIKHIERELLLNITIQYLNDQAFDKEYLSESLDWEKLYNLSIEQRMFHLAYNELLNYIPDSYRNLFQKKNEDIRKKNHDIIQEMSALSETGNDMIFVKGIILSQLLYNDPYYRVAGDIDTLIRETSVEEIDRELKAKGYFQACGKEDIYSLDFNNPDILPYPILKDLNHHEYFEYYKKVGNDYITLELQRYIHTTITSKHINRFLDENEYLIINGSKIKTLSLEHTLLHLVESIYTDANWYHRGPKLGKYFELGLFIKNYNQKIKWDEVLQKASSFNMSDIIIPIFDDLNGLFGQPIAQDIAGKLDHSKNKNRLPLIWEAPLKERLFKSNAEREAEIFKNLKRICYSEEHSKNARNAYDANELTSESISPKEYLYVQNNKHDYKLYYLPLVDTTHLNFNIYVPLELGQSEYDWEVILNTVDPCIESDILDLHTFSFVKQDGVIRTNLCNGGNIEQAGDLEIRVQIPLSEIKKSFREGILAYKIIIKERIYGGIYHVISSDGYTDKSFWLSPTLIRV
ncbi:nucleotidyltransferase family protein [Paenibacillus sp. GCM10012307]|uniref:Nucleotidyltransferase family protein n=1 Tax=Paenibacillus roseus TaxID=2798579 RepID=A0A934J4M9_9BACL|nr:nucleotidyltransferase family protein [Paenibacillus roseus]MBJ6363209.1 nucleotidyltransferase family protein [Paenibacillus roseus]